ncbi:hypothetical protein C2G38_2040996 [Gigaspora rosea]|uniref:Uncharacterized protein n=1 Tax=Gigaspora rosea TaxID=44941 RepID=A0A397UT48_9GLOM|nr:hypothetical protein C2G38_2040996 [Gigaspora rosea]
MPALLTKYPDFLAFMVRSDEPRGRIVATFVSDKETMLVVDLMFKSLAMDKWDPYLTVARKHFPNMQIVLCDWHEGFGMEKASNLQNQSYNEKNKIYIKGELLYKKKSCSRSEKFACPCSFNVIRGHDCQDIIAVRFFIGELKLQNTLFSNSSKSKLERKPQSQVLPEGGNYFETCLKYWQEPFIVSCGSEYYLMGASFCNSNYHIADVRFENVKNAGWYQYDSLKKSYCARAMFIGNSCLSHKNGYTIDFAIYVKI